MGQNPDKSPHLTGEQKIQLIDSMRNKGSYEAARERLTATARIIADRNGANGENGGSGGNGGDGGARRHNGANGENGGSGGNGGDGGARRHNGANGENGGSGGDDQS